MARFKLKIFILVVSIVRSVCVININCAYVRACKVRACVRACVRARVCVLACVLFCVLIIRFAAVLFGTCWVAVS